MIMKKLCHREKQLLLSEGFFGFKKSDVTKQLLTVNVVELKLLQKDARNMLKHWTTTAD